MTTSELLTTVTIPELILQFIKRHQEMAQLSPENAQSLTKMHECGLKSVATPPTVPSFGTFRVRLLNRPTIGLSALCAQPSLSTKFPTAQIMKREHNTFEAIKCGTQSIKQAGHLVVDGLYDLFCPQAPRSLPLNPGKNALTHDGLFNNRPEFAWTRKTCATKLKNYRIIEGG